MQATFRFWRTNQPKNGFQGKIWMDISGVEISGSVMVGKNGLYSDFRNSPKVVDEEGKVTYGKPVIILSDEVHQMTQAVVDTFWGNQGVTNVTIESSEGRLKLVKGGMQKNKQASLIEGAEEFATAAVAQIPKAVIQLPEPDKQVELSNVGEDDLPF